MTDAGPTIGLVLDCQDPSRLAAFWAAALDYVSVGEAGAYVVLIPDGRPGFPERIVQLRATINGTLVTVIERDQLGNPLARVLVRLGARESPAKRLLADLHDRLGTTRHNLSAEEKADDGH